MSTLLDLVASLENRLKARLFVNNVWVLLIFFCAYPHLQAFCQRGIKGTQRREPF